MLNFFCFLTGPMGDIVCNGTDYVSIMRFGAVNAQISLPVGASSSEHSLFAFQGYMSRDM